MRLKTRFVISLLAGLVLAHIGPAGAQALDLSRYRGKVVYLDFWASWCAPCKLSFPWLNELQRQYGADGVVIVGVNVDHDRAAAEAFLHDTPAVFPIVFDPKGAVAARYPIEGMPTSFVIGKDGKIRFTHNGFEPSHEAEYLSHVLTAVRAP